MSIHTASPKHEVLYQELIALCGRHTRDLPQIELLAVAANMVGKMIAMQDQFTYTSEQVMQVVAHNIELGNQQVLDAISKTMGKS